MNLKVHLPIIALCGLTFAVSFAVGLWWEITQQEEWRTSESAAKDVNQSIAQRRTDKEKSKPEKEGQTDAKQEKPDDGEKDKPTEDSESRPVEVTPETGVTPNISPAAVPGKGRRGRGGRRIDMNNLPPEVRAKMEARRAAMEARVRERGRVNSSVEISGESDSSIILTNETEKIIVEPDN